MNIYKINLTNYHAERLYIKCLEYIYLKETYQLEDDAQNLYEEIINDSKIIIEKSKKHKFYTSDINELMKIAIDSLKSRIDKGYYRLDKLAEYYLKEISEDVYIDNEMIKQLSTDWDKILKFLSTLQIEE